MLRMAVVAAATSALLVATAPDVHAAPMGVITEFGIPSVEGGPYGIAPGPEGNPWFVEIKKDRIGRITLGGEVSEFPIPTAESRPTGIAAGADGNMWFTEYGSNKIGRISP